MQADLQTDGTSKAFLLFFCPAGYEMGSMQAKLPSAGQNTTRVSKDPWSSPPQRAVRL